MAGCPLCAVIVLLAVALYGCSGQSGLTCGQIQQSADGSVVCMIPRDCCTSLICSLFTLGEVDIRINPCRDPVTMSILVTSGEETLLNRSGISTSQKIPIQYGSVLDTSIDLFFNSTMDTVTVGMSAFGREVIPLTTINITNPGCEEGSMKLPPACLATPPLPTSGPTMEPLPTTPTCQVLQQLGAGGDTNNCVISDGCTTLSCTYLDMYPFTLSLLPCNTPPGIKFTASNATNGVVVVNETVTNSRRIPLDEQFLPGFAIIINVYHPCNKDGIIVEVIYEHLYNSTILSPTFVPLDRSQCTGTIAPSKFPCVEEPTFSDDFCASARMSLESNGNICTTNSDCTSTVCNLNSFGIPVMYTYTIQPCTDVPSVEVFAIFNGTVILNETLFQSRIETLTVGPTNVSVHFILNQSPPDYSSVEVGVNLISTQPALEVPLVPVTNISLNKCQCPGVTCPTEPNAEIMTTTAQPDDEIMTTAETSVEPGAGNPDANQGNTQLPPASSGGDSRIIIPIIIAVLLFVALIVAIGVAIVIYVVISRRHAADLRDIQIRYKSLNTNPDDEEESNEHRNVAYLLSNT